MIEENKIKKIIFYTGWFILLFANPFLCWIFYQVYKKENQLDHIIHFSRLDRIDLQNLGVLVFVFLVGLLAIYTGKDKTNYKA